MKPTSFTGKKSIWTKSLLGLLLVTILLLMAALPAYASDPPQTVTWNIGYDTPVCLNETPGTSTITVQPLVNGAIQPGVNIAITSLDADNDDTSPFGYFVGTSPGSNKITVQTDASGIAIVQLGSSVEGGADVFFSCVLQLPAGKFKAMVGPIEFVNCIPPPPPLESTSILNAPPSYFE